jgi:outer membrane protein assembly factor BamA
MKAVVSIIFVLLALFSMAQHKRNIVVLDEQQQILKSWTSANSTEAKKTMEKMVYAYMRKGHILAAIDSITVDAENMRGYIFKGPVFQSMRIEVDPDQQYLIKKVPRVSEKFLRNLPFRPTEIEELLRGILTYLVNNGYPFAKVKLEISNLVPEQPTARLIIDKGPQIKISKINLKGEAEINAKFLISLIGIKEGDLYDESRLRKISTRLDQVQFLNEIKPHELLFTPEGVEVFLYLNSSPVSLVNGVIGLQPNPITGENVITGDVRLKLQNVLKRGELFDLNWRSLQPQTQDLRTRLNYPFLFNSPFGVMAAFDLYKRDSTFLTTNVNVGVQYFLRGGNYVKVFYEAENSNLLSGAGNSALGNIASVSNSRYGLGVFRRQLDYLPNPSKGFYLEMDGLIGTRSAILPNQDSAQTSTTYTLRLDFDWFLPLAKRHVIRLANTTRAYYAPEIFTNELFRFGGLTSQRGFDEEELWASTRSTLTLEYRFLVDRNSHAFLFYDQTFYENNAVGYLFDRPFGVGAGFSFGTNLGIFSISYGVGKQLDNPMLLRNGKVHFGYVSYF